MNYKLAMIPLLLAGMFASCDDNEVLIQTNPDYVEAGYGALSLTMTYQGATTKAVGDTLTDVATKEEKTIKSVAFLVNTKTEEISGMEAQAGAFGKYFSDEDLLSTNGLLEPLAPVTAGQEGEYTAKIRHKSDGWGNPEVIVIANYLENGLKDKLMALTKWDDVEKVLTENLVANPSTPLLMYSSKTIDAWKRSGGNNNGGGSTSATFDMNRLVSRIDIHNWAYKTAAPAEGFVLESAQLIRPRTASYLIPGLTATAPAVADIFPVSGTVDALDADYQKIDTLYAYENLNDDAATATAVQVNGTYRGGKISKIIEFKKQDTPGVMGDPIPLERNHRYVVNINPTPDSTDINWTITIKDWAESDTIKVKPQFPAPVMEFTADAFDAAGSGATWNAAAKILDISNVTASAGTLKFSTKGTNASIVKFGYKYDEDASSLGGKSIESSIVEVGKPIVTYAGAQVETPITINIPMQNDEKVPLDMYVIVCNGGNENARDTLTIKSRPVYNGVANAMPVLMKDGRYWAPINVGATTTTNKAATTGDITAACGKLFQWGRFSGVNATSSPSGDIVTNSRPVGVGDALPDMSSWDGKHITSSASDPNTQNNWLIFKEGEDNPVNDAMEADAWYQQLWNANEGKPNSNVSKTVNDPCPHGWRIPTQNEWKAIGAGQDTDALGVFWDTSNLRIKIPGAENGKDLFLPAAGFRNYSNGATTNQGSNGSYWSSSVSGYSVGIMAFNNSNVMKANFGARAYSLPVRCIQE